MSGSELIEDLRRKGQEKIDLLWDAAREELAAFTAEEEEKLRAEEQSCAREAAAAGRNMRRKQRTAALRKASTIITMAEQHLHDRLYLLAENKLAEMTRHDQEGLLRRLLKEIPDREWDSITVNPRDIEVAREIFPGIRIIEDPDILGGLIVSCSATGMTVVNTLRKRLETAWRTMGPEIVRELKACENADGTVA